MVKIYVGPERKLWILPEALLCDRVEFFKSAFRSGFRESQEKVLELPDDDPMAFELVLNDILGEKDWDGSDTGLGHLDQDSTQLIYCKAYVLADKIGRPDISKVMDGKFLEFMLTTSGTTSETPSAILAPPLCVSPVVAIFVYQNTADGSALRASLIVLAVRRLQRMVCATGEMLKEWNESTSSHPDFMFDVMRSNRVLSLAVAKPSDNFTCYHTPCVFHSKKG